MPCCRGCRRRIAAALLLEVDDRLAARHLSAPSTTAPLAMAMLRATTSARITAEEPISSFSATTSLPVMRAGDHRVARVDFPFPGGVARHTEAPPILPSPRTLPQTITALWSRRRL